MGLRDEVVRQATAEAGQSTVEFAMVAPLFILLIMSILGFALLFQNKVAMDDAVRSAARYASAHPNTWDTSANPSTNSIQGRLVHSGSIAAISNSTSTSNNFQINYYDTQAISGSSTLCGTYTNHLGLVTTGSYTETSCLVKGNLLTVSDTIYYPIPVPVVRKIVSLFYPSGVPISSSATMWEDQPCDTTVGDTGCS